MIRDLDFVQPDIVRLSLSNDRWVDVKQELTYGEQNKMLGSMLTQFEAGQPPLLDTMKIGRARMGAYILAWSMVDPEGRPVPFSVAAIDNLSADRAREIAVALEAHVERMAQEKKQSTVPVSATNS